MPSNGTRRQQMLRVALAALCSAGLIAMSLHLSKRHIPGELLSLTEKKIPSTGLASHSFMCISCF